MVTIIKMSTIKESLQKFLNGYDYTDGSINCAKIIIHNYGSQNNCQTIDLKVKHTQNDLNNFLQELDQEIKQPTIETIRGYIWLKDGSFAELFHYDPYYATEPMNWKFIRIPEIFTDLLG
jgi:methionine salvage enolase-phosphatase E1